MTAAWRDYSVPKEAPMHVADLERLYDYHYWANRRLLGVVLQLTPEQFTKPVAGSYGSIRNTLVHLLSAEWGWLDRCGGQARGGRLIPEHYPTADLLRRDMGRVEEYVRGFLDSLTDADLHRPVAFAFGGAPAESRTLGDLMQHAAVHAVHHRGQVALLLRMLGHAPGDFDFLIYTGEKRRAHA